MRKIEIRNVTFYPIRPTEKGLIGFAACSFNDQLSLNCIAVYTRPNGNGVRCLFPLRKLPSGKEINTFYPINKEVTEAITEAIAKKIKDVGKKWEEKDYENGNTNS